MLYRVFTSLPGCYTASFHYQGVIPCVFLTTRMLHCMISSLSGCYTVCFPHYQDATLYHFVTTRILYHIISYLCILPSWNRTHNRQGIHNRMFRVGLCIRHPLCQLLYHLHDICERQDPNTRHLQENRGPYLFIAGQNTQGFFFFFFFFFIVAPLIHTTLVRSLGPVGYLENVITHASWLNIGILNTVSFIIQSRHDRE